MQIRVNGSVVEVTSSLSLQEYVDSLGVSCQRMVVEYNGEIPPRERWQEILLREGDTLEIVHFVGGG